MGSISVRKLDDNVLKALRIRAAAHGISMEEEVRRILKEAVAPKEGLGDAALRIFGSEHGFDLEPLPREPHEPIDFSE